MGDGKNLSLNGAFPPYVWFSFSDEWFAELDSCLPAAKRYPVRAAWGIKDSPNAPLLMRRYIIAGFIGPQGQLVELLEYVGATVGDPAVGKLTDEEREPLQHFKDKLQQRGVDVRTGRYGLVQVHF